MVEETLKKLHKIVGIPRLEIEGIGGYPKIEKLENTSREWLKYDGFGGQTGSINVSSRYLCYLKTEDGNICAYVLKDRWERPSYYETIIDEDYILFKKSDLVELIKKAIENPEKKGETKIYGKRVIDDVVFEDGFPSGRCWKGPEVSDVLISLSLDLSLEPILSISYEKTNLRK